MLSLTESAMIIGLLKGPTIYDPVKHPDNALKRRNEVLYNLVETKNMSEADFYKLKSTPLELNLREDIAPYFVEFVRRLAENILKTKGKSLENEIFKITTTLDSKVQKASNIALIEHYKTFSSKLKNIELGLVSVEPVTGFIKAMIGGNSSANPVGLNRTYQINRQVGSAFKPFMYTYLLKEGYTLATPLMDSLIIINPGTQYEWKPENYDGKYSNKYVSMQYAITKSLNLPAVHAMTELTTPEQIADFAMKMGVSLDIKPFPSIALGACESSPLNMASAFAVFASEGMYSKPVAILKIEDENNNTVYYSQEHPQMILDGETCYLMNYALASVVDSGTAASVRKFYKGPASGKTGTTQDNTDAWFIGYTPELSTAIWFGFDNPSNKLGNLNFNGGTIAAPLWGRMMYHLSKLDKRELGKIFKIPEKIKIITLCNETGLPVENSENCTTVDTYPVNYDLYPFKSHQPK
jgi:membrane peptidoglycan carboxypeptidase